MYKDLAGPREVLDCLQPRWGKAILKVLLGWCGCTVVSKGVACVSLSAGEHCCQTSPERACKRVSEGTEVKLITPFSKVFVALTWIYSANKLLKPYVKQYLIHRKLFNSPWESLTSFLGRESCLLCTHWPKSSCSPNPDWPWGVTCGACLNIFQEVQEENVLT